MELIFALHLFSTVFMTGLVWFVQVVHYPLFREIPQDDFPNYERKNMRTGYVAIPTMVVELLTGLWLVYTDPSAFWIVNTGLLFVTAMSTALFQAPMHLLLMSQASKKTIHSLIKTNWIRTVTWSVRSCMMLWLLMKYLG